MSAKHLRESSSIDILSYNYDCRIALNHEIKKYEYPRIFEKAPESSENFKDLRLSKVKVWGNRA